MVATILGLILHLAQTIFFLVMVESPAMVDWRLVVLDLVGLILPTYLLLIVYSFRFVLLKYFEPQQFFMTFNRVA